jgi:ribose-phosphate pyrophosphokinase
MNVIGEVEGRHCILVDDIVDSGGTLCNAAEALRRTAPRGVERLRHHGVFSGGAVARVGASAIESMTVTDSILATEAMRVSATSAK